MTIKVIYTGKHELPQFETSHSAGMDLRANIEAPIVLEKGARALVPTGIKLALPDGYEAQIRPRSGLAYKHGITVLNSPGTIDADYRGDVGVLLINHGNDSFIIEDGMRVAQMVVAQYTQFTWDTVDDLDDTSRGEGGFGSTGKH
ncbi:dUTP diphosphatase [bacterium]|jgi:dUTP pyrophosphatase|nr:dUTP diphosphatase [Schleiferiaceae bacterium]MDB9998062.1 dUTP diphosphatase [bacterium]|tara:strand:- start:5 stop:439 length:435 start_codon:yes stop_codon:yes gene_type:complete